MTNELKPCPFCGGSAEVLEIEFFYDVMRDNWRVFCDDCDAQTTGFDTPEEAVAAWNRRKNESI